MNVTRKLTPKQELFIAHYLKEPNATKAAIAAGYSEKNAFKMGSDLLQKTTISDRINKRFAKIVDKLERLNCPIES